MDKAYTQSDDWWNWCVDIKAYELSPFIYMCMFFMFECVYFYCFNLIAPWTFSLIKETYVAQSIYIYNLCTTDYNPANEESISTVM